MILRRFFVEVNRLKFFPNQDSTCFLIIHLLNLITSLKSIMNKRL